MSPLNIDADPGNADWIKTLSWDLPRDAETFLAFLAGPTASVQQQRVALADFVRLPAARPMPAELHAELSRRELLDGDS